MILEFYSIFFSDLTTAYPKLSVSANFESEANIYYTANERVSLKVTVDLSRESNQYFKNEYIVYIYNNRHSRFYTQSLLGDAAVWTDTVELTEGSSADAGMYEVWLILRYSSDFRSNCSSYYDLITNPPLYIIQYSGREEISTNCILW